MFVNSDSYKPLYLQISDYLKEEISSERIKPGEKIPSETELMREYQVSRNTAQKAIEELVRNDLVERIQGKGSYVKTQKVVFKMQKMTSFSEEMRNKGLIPSSKIIFLGIKKAGVNASQKLQLNEDDLVYCIERVRYGGSIAMAYQTSYLPQKIVPGLEKKIFEDTSLFTVLENIYSLRLYRQEQTIKPVIANARLMKLLDVRNNIPLLHLEGTAFLEGNTPIEYKEIFYNADAYEFTLHSIR